MRDLSVASRGAEPGATNVADYVFANATRRPSHTALRRRVDGRWLDITSAQFADEVTDVARGLIAAGIEPGDRVALMSKTRYEWTLFDFAVLAIGAAVVPIYETSSAKQVEWILADSAAKALVVETAEHEAIVDSIRSPLPGWRTSGGSRTTQWPPSPRRGPRCRPTR